MIERKSLAIDGTTNAWGNAFLRRYRSWSLLLLSLLIVSSSAGLVYGWPALRQQLQDDGSNLTEKQFGLIYTIGSWSTQGGRFFMGIAPDRFGTKRITCLSLIFLMIGLVGVGLCEPNNVIALSISLFFIGLGSAAQLCVQPVAGLFPNHVGIVLSSLSGAFQVSGLIFLLLANNTRIISFFIFTCSILFITIVSAFMLPKCSSFSLPKEADRDDDEKHEQDEGQDEDCNRVIENSNRIGSVRQNDQQEREKLSCLPPVLSENTTRLEPTMIAERKQNQLEENSVEIEMTNNDDNNDSRTTVIDDNPKIPTVFEQMKTMEYILLCTWFSISIIPLQYYVGTIGYQLEEMGDDDGFYTDIFAYTYAGAAITSPLAGFAADKFGLGVAQVLSTFLVALSFFFLAATTNISLNVQAIGLASYGIGRMGIFGLFFTNCGKRFGYHNYGTLAGFGLLTSAICSIFQYMLIGWTVSGYATIVNLVLGAILIAQAPYCGWMYRREKLYESAISVQKKRL